MKKNQNIAVAKVGMQRDLSKDSLDEKSYTIAFNMNVESEDGDLYKLRSEFSNILASKFKQGFKVLGFETDELNDRTFFFLTNPITKVSEIGTIGDITTLSDVTDAERNCKDCQYERVLGEPLEGVAQVPHQQYTTLLEDSCNLCLNFDVRYPIKKIVIKNEKLGTKIFFTDNYNPPRYFDESKLNLYKETGSTICDTDTVEAVCVNCERLRMFPLSEPLRMSPDTIVLGGNLKLGQYSFYAAYSDSLGQEASEYTALTQPVSIFDQNNKILTNKEELGRTNFAIKLTVTDLDSRYDYYKIAVAYTNIADGGTRYFEVGKFPVTNTTVLFTTEQDKKELSINDILLPNPNIKLLEGVSEVNDYLVGYGVTREKEWNLQPVVNLLGGFLKWQTHITTEDAYEDGVNTALYKGYMRDEVYPFAIAFKTDNGYTTARFPLIARPSTATDLQVIDNDDLDSINANLNNCAAGSRDKRWQLYNTAVEEGQCDPGSIPTNIVTEPVTKTSTVALGTSTSNTFLIEDPENYTTLENFINKVLEEDCFGYPFCTAADPTSIPDVAPSFTDCDTPQKIDPDIVEVDTIVGDTIITNYINYPTEYRRLILQKICNPFQYSSSDGSSFLVDVDFQAEYLYGGPIPVYYRNYMFTNDKPRNAIELNPVDNASDPVNKTYFHDYLGSSAIDTPTAILGLVQTGYTGTAAFSCGSCGNFSFPYNFQNQLHKNAMWWSVNLTDNPDAILEVLKGIVPDGSDIVPVSVDLRISFFSQTEPSNALYSVIYSGIDGIRFKFHLDSGTGTLTVLDDSDVPSTVISVPSYNTLANKKKIYIAIDTPISTLYSGRSVATASPFCFGVEIRDREIDTLEVQYDSISFNRTQRYVADCDFEVPIVSQCVVAPNKYGEFSYWESVEAYPDNEELFDSSSLDIRSVDFTDPSNATEFQLKYADGITSGRYILGSKADFTCKPIRHYKFPDNKISPFMYEYPQAGFSKSIIYPLGVTIDDTLINDFLDVAVRNGLVDQEQRDSIVGYEIFRGDRSIDKGIVAKGLLYDMYNYTERSKNIWFSNFPYNDLGENKLMYNEGRTQVIQHPFGSDYNHNFTFHSPETEFYRPTLPSDMKVEGYLFGKSKGVFEDVEDHPKYVILGLEAKKLAAKLATLEVIAEAAVIAAQSAEVYRIQFGLANSINPVGIVLGIISIALNIVSSAVFRYGKYKYQWLKSFEDLGSPRNFAKYYTSVGEYNYLQLLQTEGNQLRGINKGVYLNSGRAVTVNEIGGEKIEINNVQRERSVFITLGGDHPLHYPVGYKQYDNNEANPDLNSRFYEGETYFCSKGRSPELERNIASPYVSLKNYLPSQYGTIDSVDWLTTSYSGDLSNPTAGCKPIFGGDIFISRHTLKRKTPLFLTTAMGLASKTPFNYQSYGNFGTEPAFYANFSTPDEVTLDRGIPTIETEYSFDCITGNLSFYVDPPSKFYLYYYGIPSFLTETTINTNYRTALPLPKDLFWPLVGDYVDWTQQKNVPISENNTYYYNSQYSSNPRISIGRTLPATYNKREFDILYDSPSGLIYSRPDNNENSLAEPWLTYRPLDKFDFPTAYGKLAEVRAIESGQVRARFDTTVAVFNSFNTIVEDGSKPDAQTLGDGFKRRPVTFSETDLGYAGSQSAAMISNEMGHFWADAKRGQVFHMEPAARGINEISAAIGKNPSGMKNWFKEHLPFRIKDPLVINSKDIDVDNPYNGIGLTMGWDTRYKRVFLTKKDYKPLKQSIYADRAFYKPDGYDDIISTYQSNGYTYDGIVGSNLQFSKLTTGLIVETVIENEPMTEIPLTDTRYFKETSFTIAYNSSTGSWVSYYDFLPNYYLNHNDYFQTGINTTSDSSEFGLWSHLLTNKSYGVFYGKKYEMGFEFPFKNNYNSKTLETIEIWMEGIRYHNDYDYAYHRDVIFNKMWVYNKREASGELHLKPQKTLIDNRKYPNTVGNYQEILTTNTNDRWNVNYIFNRVSNERLNQPIFNWDDNQIHKTFNDSIVKFKGKRVLEPMRGDNFLVYLGYDLDTRYALEFKWATNTEDIR